MQCQKLSILKNNKVKRFKNSQLTHNGEILKEMILPSNILKSNKLEQPSCVLAVPLRIVTLFSIDIDEKDVST